MPRFPHPAALLLALALAACSATLIDNDEGRELLNGLRTWDARPFTDYTIESRSSCFCAHELNEWVRLEVVGGGVQRATILSTGEVITDSRLTMWRTVEELFEDLITSTSSDAIADITFTLDPALGFPTTVTWIEKSGVADAGGSRSLRNAMSLPVE